MSDVPREHLYLDAPSLMYRAFFALPATITDEGGRSVNAVRGYLYMLVRLFEDRQPADVVSVFDDDWRPAARVAVYSGYKSQRADDPPELEGQFELLHDVLDAAGLVRVDAPGLEADDAIATLVQDEHAPDVATIVTGDRDLLALVRDPYVKLLFTVKGVSELVEFDEGAVEERYGIPPRLYGDFAILRGDPSDGLPGVPGVGPTRAAKLLKEFGSLDGILENVDALPPKQRESFVAARSYLEAMPEVVGLVTDARIRRTSAAPPDRERLMEIISERNLGSAGAKLLTVLG